MPKTIREVSKRNISVAAKQQLAPRDHKRSSGLLMAGLVAQVQAEREQLFKAIGIVELCRLATTSLLETNEAECMVPALETTCDLLNASAERLEWISADLRRLSQA